MVNNRSTAARKATVRATRSTLRPMITLLRVSGLIDVKYRRTFIRGVYETSLHVGDRELSEAPVVGACSRRMAEGLDYVLYQSVIFDFFADEDRQ